MQRIERVTSAANPLVKEVRRAVSRGRLTSDGLAVAEGIHLVEEARRSDCEVPVILHAESAQMPGGEWRRKGPRIAVVPDSLFDTIAATETSQGVIALVRPREWSEEELFGERTLIVVLDGIQDPGNAGTIVRAAEAFGATGVIFEKGSASPHHPKTLRASAGSLFRMPVLSNFEAGETSSLLQRSGVTVHAAVAHGGKEVEKADLRVPCALVIGSEAHGVSAEWRNAEKIRIPVAGVESLNAGVAASILLYEARRQRAHEPVR